MSVPHRKHICGTSRPVTEIALLLVRRLCSYLTGNICGTSRSVTEIALLLVCRLCSYLTGNTYAGLHGLLRRYLYFQYVDYVRTSQETHVWDFTTCYRESSTFFTFYLHPLPNSHQSASILHILLLVYIDFIYSRHWLSRMGEQTYTSTRSWSLDARLRWMVRFKSSLLYPKRQMSPVSIEQQAE
jgi:hypothetical protein